MEIKQTVETVCVYAKWDGRGVNLSVINESVSLDQQEVAKLIKGLKKAAAKAAKNAAARAKEDK